jgi:hypothetical protein
MRPTIVTALLAAAAVTAACWNGAAQAPLTPKTDVTLTSSQTYARRPQYAITRSARTNGTLTMSVDVIDLGRAKAIAKEAIAEQKGDASSVVAYVYGPQGRLTEPAWGRLEWSAAKGYGTFERRADAREPWSKEAPSAIAK